MNECATAWRRTWAVWAVLAVLAVALWPMVGVARAGAGKGATLSSVADGDWHTAATWTGGPPDYPGMTTTVEIYDLVEITDPAGGEALDVGLYSGRLDIYSSLTTPDIFADAGPKVVLHDTATLNVTNAYIFGLSSIGQTELHVDGIAHVPYLLAEAGSSTFAKSGLGDMTLGSCGLPPSSTFIMDDGTVISTVGRFGYPVGAAEVLLRGGDWNLDVASGAPPTSAITNSMTFGESSRVTIVGDPDMTPNTIIFSGNVDLGLDPTVTAEFGSTNGDIINFTGQITGDGGLYFVEGTVVSDGEIDCDSLDNEADLDINGNGVPDDCEAYAGEIGNNGSFNALDACVEAEGLIDNNGEWNCEGNSNVCAGEIDNGGSWTNDANHNGVPDDCDIEAGRFDNYGTCANLVPDAGDTITFTIVDTFSSNQLVASGLGTVTVIVPNFVGQTGNLTEVDGATFVITSEALAISDLNLRGVNGALVELSAQGTGGLTAGDCTATLTGGSRMDIDADIDLVDLDRFTVALGGPGTTDVNECHVEADDDADIDLKDFIAFQGAFSCQGQNVNITGSEPGSTLSASEETVITTTAGPAGTVGVDRIAIILDDSDWCAPQGAMCVGPEATVTLQNYSSMDVSGALTVDGDIEITDSVVIVQGGATHGAGSTTVWSGGTYDVSGAGNLLRIVDANGEVIVKPAGQLFSRGDTTNEGSIEVEGGEATFEGGLENKPGGVIRVTSSGRIQIFGLFETSGRLELDHGTAEASGGARHLAGSETIVGPGATYDTRGSLLEITDATGQVIVREGGEILADKVELGAILQLELVGTGPGEFGRMEADDLNLLGGTLKLAFGPAYEPLVGDEWDLLDWVTLSGTFDLLDFPVLSGDLYWVDTELYVTGTVAVQPEPATMALLAVGALSLLTRRRRK